MEKKISHISSRITELEILLSFMEAKLNSIPGLEELEIKQNNSNPNPASASNEMVTDIKLTANTIESNSKLDDNENLAEYAQFFRLLKLGVPLAVVETKVLAANLDPRVLSRSELL